MSLFSRILASTFPAMLRRAIPRLFPHRALSPLFLYMVMRVASFQLFGSSASFQIRDIISKRKVCNEEPPCVRSSAGIPSGPGDFRGFIDLIAATISSNEGGVSRSVQGCAVGRSSSTEWSEGLFAFRRPEKCSAHLARIPCRSLISVLPSDDRTGRMDLFLGP